MTTGENAHTRTAALLDERRTLVMGIVNVTPDSFSDGGRYLAAEAATEHALRLIAEGADIVDIGGESTRPPGRDYGAGSAVVDAASEIARVIPVIEGIRAANATVPISIDTMKPEVARSAAEAGATIINDVSAGRFDEMIWQIAAAHDLPYILMHGHDPARIESVDAFHYDDVIADVRSFLASRIAAAREAGVRRIIADVGIGFAKGLGENVALLRGHRAFLALGVPLLVGASRKSFIGRLLGGAPPEARVTGSLAAHAVAVLNGASILRVHDVRETVEFLHVFTPLITGTT
jgi:dihydropteroate synthase